MLTWESEGFAYAEGWDEQRARYRGLRVAGPGSVSLDGYSLVVKPEAARRQLDIEPVVQPAQTKGSYPDPQPNGSGKSIANGGTAIAESPTGSSTQVETPAKLGRFHGSVTLDSGRAGRDAGRIAEEVIQHLTSLIGSTVEITLEIQATIPDGVPENVVRTVTENCRTLRFKSHGFEQE